MIYSYIDKWKTEKIVIEVQNSNIFIEAELLGIE